MRKRKLDKVLVEIAKPKIRHGKWQFGGRSVRGQVYEYPVIDQNFEQYKKWTFQVSVPKEIRKGSYIEVRPIRHPQRRCWEGIARKSINFTRCSKEPYRSMVYAKVTLADPSDEKTKVEMKWRQRLEMPRWMRGFGFKPKNAVATTKGTDAGTLVVVLRPDDHKKMIRFFLVTKAWVLYKDFILDN